MPATTKSASKGSAKTSSAKQQFLETYDREHATTMKVLRNYPADKADMRPHPKLRTARELAWTFVLERGLGTKVFNDEFAKQPPSGKPAEPPPSWNDLLGALEKAHADFGNLVRSTSEEKLRETVKFFTAPKTMGDIRRMDLLWFLLHDEIHHRGQFSVYLRLADAKVPSIYGPSGDEPWM
ncbi:MAG: DinB family protein [Gemmatimonadetes bacterium]|nr:DinB family protein [Gemmatimonadota bacterium]